MKYRLLRILEIPTVAAMQGPGFHWDSAILCDVTVVSDDCKFDNSHLHYGLVPGDGMGLLLQHYLGTKRPLEARAGDHRHAGAPDAGKLGRP